MLRRFTFSPSPSLSRHGDKTINWTDTGFLHPQWGFSRTARPKLQRRHTEQRWKQDCKCEPGNTYTASTPPLRLSLFLKNYPGCTSTRIIRKGFFLCVCRTWTPQARARPVQTGPSFPETKLPQHRTTTRRKGSRCCLMVRPLCHSYHSVPLRHLFPFTQDGWGSLALSCIWCWMVIGEKIICSVYFRPL